ncbi:alpha/beta fold hydrolase [Chitinophaga sancti]|uniref:Alpha/beta hydrolase n=1 Tax=Chitinophaga sancti TaxID=1004 RepID=A0A1K1RVJ2_9BACT|nr:alpha/beta hydrolase [Chitinophaga sancti]WQD62323.1 alpha/beta hydrolase [Chitinophaga sancti]WQG92108.1 alpha/beta hydrolase [Chitinophaga sancti]SFW75946.1 Pimeloyl-ACP methyl ester carboxylesterase [Chitinophaga sancti]
MKNIFLLTILMIAKMTNTNAQNSNASNTDYSYATVPTKFVQANGIKFAYRSYGKTGDIPVIYFNHLAANLDNCDPRIMDAIAANRQIISFDYRGVGATTGKQGASIADMAKDGIAFIHALGYKQVDIVAFSMGGFITQEILLVEPQLVRKAILAGTGPRGGAGIPDVVGTTYSDIFKSLLTFRDAKFYLFFIQNKVGKDAARNFLKRLKERKENRDKKVNLYVLKKQLHAIKKWGNENPMDLSAFDLPVFIANGDADRMVPSPLSNDMAKRFPNAQIKIYPNSGHGGIFQYHKEFIPQAIEFLNK